MIKLTKTIKHHVLDLDEDVYYQLDFICVQYSQIKNFVFRRYAGIKHLRDCFDAKNTKTIVNKQFSETESKVIPYKYFQEATLEALANLQSAWRNLFNRVGLLARNNENFNDEEKRYALYVLAVPAIMHAILNHEDYSFKKKTDVFGGVNYRKVEQYLRRNVRKFKFNTPVAKQMRSIQIEPSSYTCDNGTLCVSGLTKGKRMGLRLTDNLTIKGKCLRVVLDRNNKRCSVGVPVEAKTMTKEPNQLSSGQKLKLVPPASKREPRVVGVDVNYSNVIATDNGSVYGDGIGKLEMKFTRLVVNKERKRQWYRQLIKELEKRVKESKCEKEKMRLCIKIDNIKKNNLGDKKITRNREKIVETHKSLVNHALNHFIYEQKPTVVVAEDLTKRIPKNKKKKIRKDVSHSLNNWRKGYANERLEYKSHVFNFEIVRVNAAYTSQECSNCHYLQGRSKTDKFECGECGYKAITHVNSGRVVLSRYGDEEITLYTKYKKVKEILVSRYEARKKAS